MNQVDQRPIAAFAVAVLGIGALSSMDAVMKGLSQDIGAFATMCWRSLLATALLVIPYYLTRKSAPQKGAMRLHLFRAALMIPMAFLFFWGLARVPMAQAIALSFIAPLTSLFLAAIFLKERIGPRTLAGSLLALVGVAVIFIGQGEADLGPEALRGSLAILGSAIFYAVNIVVMRSQAQQAGPLEIAFYQYLFGAIGFWLFVPVAGLPAWPAGHESALLLATLLSMAGMVLLAWAYARAGAAYLSNSEYSGFIFAMILGWLVFAEHVTPFTLAGGVLIIAGCLVAARTRKIKHPTLESVA
jgi:S-adenosylmethionine uptake transporter